MRPDDCEEGGKRKRGRGGGGGEIRRGRRRGMLCAGLEARGAYERDLGEGTDVVCRDE